MQKIVAKALAGCSNPAYKPPHDAAASTARPSSSGLGRRPFTAETRVRVPLGVPTSSLPVQKQASGIGVSYWSNCTWRYVTAFYIQGRFVLAEQCPPRKFLLVECFDICGCRAGILYPSTREEYVQVVILVLRRIGFLRSVQDHGNAEPVVDEMLHVKKNFGERVCF